MASKNAVHTKTNFFYFPFQTKLNKNNSEQGAQDTFQASMPAPTFNKLPDQGKPQALAQGDEVARKGGLLDCFGLLGLLALCCICCQGSGNSGFGRRYAADTKKKKNNPPPPPPPPQATVVEPAII